MLSLISLTGWDLHYTQQRKALLVEQLQQAEAEEQAARDKAAQQQAEYENSLAQWRAETKKIEAQNTQRITQWQRELRRYQNRAEQLVKATPPAPPPPAADLVLDGEGNLTAVPLPAPAPAPAQVVNNIEIVIPSAPKLDTAPPPPEPPPANIVEVSASNGIRIELQRDTTWQQILQLIALILVTYAGIKIINKYTRDAEPA